MPPLHSTRLDIVTKSLDDCMERLRDLPSTPRVREFRTKAQSYERAVQAWVTRPPTEEQRSTMVKLVLELNMEVMALGRPDKTEK
jgi:hypothetical protein